MDLNRIFKILYMPPFHYCFDEYPHNSGLDNRLKDLTPKHQGCHFVAYE
jgi:hypothetical protein